MTDSVKPLPTGSTDKKVEHIADYLERAMAEVALAGNAPDNLLRNPSFAEYYSATLSNDILYGHAVDKAKSFNFMKGIAKPICPSWSIEVQHGGSISYCKVKSGRYGTADLHQNKDGNAVMFGGLGMTGNGANAVLFQEFDTPTLIEDGEQNYYAYVRCCQAGGPQKIRFGICDLDGDGNATSIRASRTIELPAGLYDVKEFWLEIPSLAEGGATINYRKRAFFIESARGVCCPWKVQGCTTAKPDKCQNSITPIKASEKSSLSPRSSQKQTQPFSYLALRAVTQLINTCRLSSWVTKVLSLNSKRETPISAWAMMAPSRCRTLAW
ncbi:hypothetical protein [Vibrio diabolicus]|uniref:hypothetical protein n=1 Tax=Vibrio diabolicus TaxID=50719 RepID=UPI002174E3C4|nr:hypothetical protein [Vibrio diabolicus]